MEKTHKITMLGTGLIGTFYTMTLHGQRSGERVNMVYSRTKERASDFAKQWGIPRWTNNLDEAIHDPETDVVVIGLPNDKHLEATRVAAEAKKTILCTKPLGRTMTEAKDMLDIVEKASVFNGYLEDLVYTPKTLKSLDAIRKGAFGKILWVRSRETHAGPHSAWFWNKEQAGGGAVVDMGCHCIEIIRNFVGKGNKPVEVMCYTDTLVHQVEAEDHGIGLIRFEDRALGQFEVSWAFRGGMDLRDEVSGTEGTIWLDHFLRTGIEMFTAVGSGGYVAEKAEGEKGWLFPVGDEVHALGYINMFKDMFNALDNDCKPAETFYDGYVVNAIIDACYKSARTKRWEPVELRAWRDGYQPKNVVPAAAAADKEYMLIKEERMPDGRIKLILKEKASGKIVQKIKEE